MLAAAPVALYAAVFVLVNVTYVAFCWEAVDRPAHEDVSQLMRRMLRMRSVITIGVFTAAALIALIWPVAGMALICLCLVGYLGPDIPGPKTLRSKGTDPHGAADSGQDLRLRPDAVDRRGLGGVANERT